jgi:phosphoglycerol transferase MdoB-like AlkP superfamily enzyme
VRHQCWGRDLLNLPQGDSGFGVIKPSGTEQTTAIISDDQILVMPKEKEMAPKMYRYELGANPHAEIVPDAPRTAELKLKLESFLQTATKSLLDNTAGVVDGKPD